ncbi:UNVERIFIED_CONTAM: hypothetical protein K2H54_057979 [Gekko kuhli]
MKESPCCVFYWSEACQACFNCQEGGHLRFNCPKWEKGKQISAKTVNVVKMSETATKLHQSPESEDTKLQRPARVCHRTMTSAKRSTQSIMVLVFILYNKNGFSSRHIIT